MKRVKVCPKCEQHNENEIRTIQMETTPKDCVKQQQKCQQTKKFRMEKTTTKNMNAIVRTI